MKRFFRRLSAILLLSGLLPLLSGCGESYEIREYAAPRENDEVVTSEVLKSQFPSIPFKWEVSEAWEVAENDQFSTSAWKTGPVAQEARITLSKLNSAAGVRQQVLRWRGQLELETATEEELANSYEERTLGELPTTFISISNDSETILGLIAVIDEDMWIFKYRAPNATAKKTADSFRQFVDGLEVVK